MGTAKNFLVLASVIFMLGLQSCKKSMPVEEEIAVDGKKKKNPPSPPPPPPFYFTNCNTPTYSASFPVGLPANVAIIKNYVNSPGGSYPAFTSATVNGITITAEAGTFNTGSGSVTFTATGTPINTGFFNVWISVGNIQPCMMFFTVANAPVSGPTVDPGPTAGSTGIVNFVYKGQPVAYQTVRAKDGKIWLQQNLGSPQVAFHEYDEASFGDFFQWGRWDDGHQSRTSSSITGGSTLLNPSHIPLGNPNFIIGTTAAGTRWWGVGGLATDTWSGTSITATNGKDPCTALGAGWRLPTAAEWNTVSFVEDLFGTLAAFGSNLKLTTSGYRYSNDGFFYPVGDIGYYWTSTAVDNSNAKVFFFDNLYNAGIASSARGEGFNCRCVK
jgi:hypothetical protein